MRTLSRNPSGRRRMDRSCSIWLLALATLLMVINEQQLAVADATESSVSPAIDTEGDASSGERILSRKRRYIVFPQGASLQLVYDTVYPLLDKANLVYIGVTAALAYRLPSDPIHLDEDFANAVENGAFSPFDRVGPTDAGTAVADTDTPSSNITRRPVDTYYNQQQSSASPVQPDKYYTSQAQSQPQGQPQAQPFKPSFSPSRKDTYELGGPDAPGDLYYGPGQGGGPPPNRYYTNVGRYPGPPEKGVIDKFSNKMDYYFSYADKVLRTIKGLAEKKVDPWKNVKWNVNNFANQNRNYFNRRVSEAHAGPPQPPSPPFAASGSAAPVINRGGGFVAGNRQHAIHPVFGRRRRRTVSAPSEAGARPPRMGVADASADVDETLLEPLTEMDKYHLHLHRTSRHHLYKRIARLIDMKNMNGSECVQRALCETRRQPSDAEPDAFLVEIMRAVFTLPRAVKRTVATGDEDLYRLYDEAHFVNGDRTGVACTAAYPLCEGSVWSDAFRM